MERARLQVLDRPGGVVDDFQRPQGAAARFGQGLAGVGQAHPPPVALQELQADGLLEVADLLRHGGLGQVEVGRRPRDVLRLRDLDERPDLLQGEGRLAHRNILGWLMKKITNY